MQMCHLAILSVAKIWNMELTAHPHLGPRIRRRGDVQYLYSTRHVSFHRQQFTSFCFFWLFHADGYGAYCFCSLLLNRSVDHITVLLLLFSAVEQVRRSNRCSVTSALCC
jgi:hypothetical protein